VIENIDALVAQLDRASDFELEIAPNLAKHGERLTANFPFICRHFSLTLSSRTTYQHARSERQIVSKTFTDLTVKSLPQGKHFDASTPAFGMRVGKNRRTWIVQRGVDRRIIRVGHYPALSLQDARKAAKKLLASTTSTPTG
jgi:hypothetical protein